MARYREIQNKRDYFNQVNFPLIQSYLDLFFQTTNAYIDDNQSVFQDKRNQLIESACQIRDKFAIPFDEVCRFANEYHDFTNLVNGKFIRSQCDHLYFVRGGNFIKIGRTLDLKTRISQLQVSSIERLEYIKIFKLRGCYEFWVHDIFDYLRVRGEWFQNHKDIHNYIELLSTQNSEIAGIYGIQDPT